MAAYKEMTQRSWPWWRCALTALSTLALALSAYLGWHYLVRGSVIGCGGGSPCERVLSSRWSSIAGVLPVAGLAAGAYFALLVATLSIGPSSAPPVRRLAWRAMLVLVGAAAGSAIWFTILQKWIIRAFCPYCMATHITGLLLATLVIWRAPGGNDERGMMNDESQSRERLARGRLFILPYLLVGLLLAGAMAASQAAFTPPPIYRAGESPTSAPAADPQAEPLVGSPDAPYVVTLLFDYKCPHCQQMHFLLDEAIRRYNGKLAFVLRPTPLNSKCNPFIPRDVDEFKDSCELARVVLAVWVANRQAFGTFDAWMFSVDSGDGWVPRTLAAARAKAVELVGQTRFDAALADPWIDQYMQASIRLYGDTIQGGNNAVPKLVFGSRWVIPQPYDADDLMTILQHSLRVPKP